MSFQQGEAVRPPSALEHLIVIGTAKSLSLLDGYARSICADWGAGCLSDEDAQRLAEAVEARRREVRGTDRVVVRAPEVSTAAKAAGRASHFPPKRKAPRSPDRAASMARRRTLAASGPMPPALAALFTTGELAALRIVADAVRDRGVCMLALGEIAARAGICVTTARNAMRLAAQEGVLTIEERRRDKRPNLPNVVRIISQEWRSWIERGRRMNSPTPAAEGGGCKKTGPTDKASFRSIHGDHALRGQHPPKVVRKAPLGVLRTT